MSNGGRRIASLALVTDTHYWPPSAARSDFVARMDAAPERDGLLVAKSPQVVSQLLKELANFSLRCGTAMIHMGDTVCGGGGFSQPENEYRSSLLSLRALESQALNGSRWFPLYHTPGNHDVAPAPVRGRQARGLAAWRATFAHPPSRAHGTASYSGGDSVESHPVGMAAAAADAPPPAYRVLPTVGMAWRVLLLDSMDGVTTDEDGHGYIGASQLGWLDTQLRLASQLKLSIVLIMHQLLVDPSKEDEDERRRARKRRLSGGTPSTEHGHPAAGWLGPTEQSHSGGGPSWIGAGDLIRNRAEVLRVLSNHTRTVKLSVHGHVHANTITRWRGIPFVTLAATTEWPMQWHELQLAPCALKLVQHDLRLPPATRVESMRRDTRPNRNNIKLGRAHRPQGMPEVVAMPSTVETEADALAPVATTLEVNMC